MKAIVFAPSLFRNGSEHSNPLLSMQNIGKASAIVRHLVLNVNEIFEPTAEDQAMANERKTRTTECQPQRTEAKPKSQESKSKTQTSKPKSTGALPTSASQPKMNGGMTQTKKTGARQSYQALNLKKKS